MYQIASSNIVNCNGQYSVKFIFIYHKQSHLGTAISDASKRRVKIEKQFCQKCITRYDWCRSIVNWWLIEWVIGVQRQVNNCRLYFGRSKLHFHAMMNSRLLDHWSTLPWFRANQSLLLRAYQRTRKYKFSSHWFDQTDAQTWVELYKHYTKVVFLVIH